MRADGFQPTSLDHVALWVSDVDRLADLLCDHLGMHLVERGDDFRLVGVDAREGKLTLFEAEGPRERGLLERVFLRVNDLDAAADQLPDELSPRTNGESIEIDGPEGFGLGLVASEGLDYDLDHVVLQVREPEATGEALAEVGFERQNGVLAVGNRRLRLEQGDPSDDGRPLLNHLALLVDSAEDVKTEAESRGLEIEKVVDAENTIAVFVRGPEGILLEYVEHKPTFSLT